MKSYDEVTNNLLERRDKYNEIQKAKRKTMVHISSFVSCFVIVAVLGIGVLQGDWLDFNSLPIVNPSTQEGGNTEQTSKNTTTLQCENTCYPIQQQTETTVHVNDEKTTTNDATVEKDITDIGEDELTTSKVHQEEITTVNSQDKVPNYSLYTLSMWLNEPGVIWGSDTVKGGLIISEKTPMGTIKITDSLKEMFNGNDETTIYAVIVDFSSCINDEDIENFEFNGISISKLQSEFEKSEKDDKSIKEYKNELYKIKTAYYDMKIESFRNSFNKAELEIYINEKYPDSSTQCFYTFGTEEQLKKLACKSDEAFILVPAGKPVF